MSNGNGTSADPTVFLELPATIVARLRAKAESVGRPLDVYLGQLAELDVPAGAQRSLFDLIGKAPTLRSGEDIARQVDEERDAWSGP